MNYLHDAKHRAEKEALMTSERKLNIQRISIRTAPKPLQRNWRTVYIGRKCRTHDQSPLANPFTVQRYGKGTASKMFRKWLWEKIQADDFAVMTELNRISVTADYIMCWCDEDYPDCHGEVILKAIKWLREEGRIQSERDRPKKVYSTSKNRRA